MPVGSLEASRLGRSRSMKHVEGKKDRMLSFFSFLDTIPVRIMPIFNGIDSARDPKSDI